MSFEDEKGYIEIGKDESDQFFRDHGIISVEKRREELVKALNTGEKARL